MPYRSSKQRSYFNANRAKLEAEGVDVDEWNESSKGKKLPKQAQETFVPGRLPDHIRPAGSLEKLQAVMRQNAQRRIAPPQAPKPAQVAAPPKLPAKTAVVNFDDILKTVAPVTSNVRNVHQLLPRPTGTDFSERVGDYLSAEDESIKGDKEKETPFWKRMVRDSLIGAGLGGGLAAAKAYPVARGFSPEATAVGAGLGLVGSGGLTLARHLLRESLSDRAEKRLHDADDGVKFVANHPETREKAKEWANAQWSPYSGAEVGGILGGIAPLGAAWALGKTPTTGQSWGLSLGGAAAGAVLGHLLGRWHRNKKQREFLENTDKALSTMTRPGAKEEFMSKAAAPVLSQDELADLLKTAARAPGGWPTVSTNAGLLRGMGGKVDQYVAGKHGMRKFNGADELFELCGALEKLADDALSLQNSDPAGDEPAVPVEPKVTSKPTPEKPPSADASVQASPTIKVSADSKKLRNRSEVLISDSEGVLAIKKSGYLLMPGGGIQEGEDAEKAVARETSEEAGRKLKALSKHSTVIDVLFAPDNILSKGFDGESTTFFTALDGGDDDTQHKDREPFKFIPYDEAIQHLVDCMAKPEAAWALPNNATRLFLISKLRDEANGTADDIRDAEHGYDKEANTKLADAAVYAPRNEVIYFTPTGNIAVRKGKGRRYDLPSDIPGAVAVPYETPVSMLPDEGVPEPGVHGYRYSLSSAEGVLPEGFEEETPDNVLKNLYATLGNPRHRAFMNLDRARARALLRLMKSRTPNA